MNLGNARAPSFSPLPFPKGEDQGEGLFLGLPNDSKPFRIRLLTLPFLDRGGEGV